MHVARYGASGRLARDLGYVWMTRRRKKRYTVGIDFKQVQKNLNALFKPFKKAKNRDLNQEKQLQEAYLKYIEMAINEAHMDLFNEVKQSIIQALSRGLYAFIDHAFNVYYLKSSYVLKPPRTLPFLKIFARRQIQKYAYTPSLYEKTKSFFQGVNQIVDIHRGRIFYKNGRVKIGKFRDFFSHLYEYFVEAGHLSDVTIKKPLNAQFQSNGGIYAWEYMGEIVYIGRTNNFSARMRQHADCFASGCPEKKYNSGLDPNRVMIQLLAITNDENAQKVLETVYFHKHQPRLNAVGTLSVHKILKNQDFNAIFQETLNSDHQVADEEKATMKEQREAHLKTFEAAHAAYKKTLIY